MITCSTRILLADDDEDDCFFFDKILTGLSVATTLTVVGDGEQLMNLLRQESTPLPDLLFLDLNMPRLNGLECLTAIKSDERLTHLPVVILSTFIAPEIEAKLHTLGAMHCIQKATDYNQLKARIEQTIGVLRTTANAPAGETRTSNTSSVGELL